MFRALTIVLLGIALLVTMKDGYWEACRPGKLEGRPNLKRKSCEPVGLAGGVEYWRCPSPIDSAPG